MQLMVFIYIVDYLFAMMINWNTQQPLKEDLLILFCYFTLFSSFCLLLSLFKLSCTKNNHACNLYRMSYTFSFCFLMYCIVSEKCNGGRFLEDSLYCYSQQIISAVLFIIIVIIINNFFFVGIIQHLKILQIVFRPKKLIKPNYKPSKMKVLKDTFQQSF